MTNWTYIALFALAACQSGPQISNRDHARDWVEAHYGEDVAQHTGITCPPMQTILCQRVRCEATVPDHGRLTIICPCDRSGDCWAAGE